VKVLKQVAPLFLFVFWLSDFSLLQAQENLVYLKAGKLFDGHSNQLRNDMVIVVKGNKILSIGKNISIPSEATKLDLSGMTVMPGLIDAHTHIVLHPGNYEDQIIRETPEYRAIYGTVSAKSTLEAGITTIRDAGNEGAGYADVALRDAINSGIVPGPRIQVSIQPVSGTGSYNLVGFSPYFRVPNISYEADGPSEIRKQVRRLIKEGADLIKVYMESFEKKQMRTDILTGALNYSKEELKVLVEEAHKAGLPVAAHTYSDQAARLAVEVNVNSIEHGLYLSEETFNLMAEKNIYYVPTLLVYEFWRDSKIFGQISPENKIKLTNTVEEHTKTFKRAMNTPVKIVFGSDTFELPGTNAQEIELMVKYGMQPINALKSATSIAAELLGLESSVGTIAENMVADIIAVDGNPLENISDLRKVVFVMKDGEIYLDRH
jgi:imidazolonepropionase-like amidohydrolase